MSKTVLTVSDMVTYQQPGKMPQGFSHPFCRSVKDGCQPWVRQLRIGEEWTQLDAGWVDNAACMILLNEEGTNLRVIPTPEEVEAMKKKVLEITYDGPPENGKWLYPAGLIFPGETRREHPINLGSIYLRSRSGEINCLLWLFPE